MTHIDQQAEYVVRVHGHVDASLLDESGPVRIAGVAAGGEREAATELRVVTDQAGLIGLIRHLHGLGIVLLAVERVVSLR